MKKDGYYSSGEFARKAQVTLRTIRYYDQKNILKPTYVNEAGARFYTDQDFARLQQILLLKYLGFALEDIKEMTVSDLDSHFMLDSLHIQLRLAQERMEQMQLVEHAIQDTITKLEAHEDINWSETLDLIHLTNVEKNLRNQYQNASNVSARINLHKLYSKNGQGWFPWLYQQCNLLSDLRILELGCGDGTLWTSNSTLLPPDISILLSDISTGMLNDARRNIGADDTRFTFQTLDCHTLPFADGSFDLVVANHLLFYCDDIPEVCRQVSRVLKPSGQFICSTYGKSHMQEIGQLVQRFDEHITLSNDNLPQRFGRENGGDLLAQHFSNVQWASYEDALYVTEPESLISYVLSCHGNQNQYLLSRYKDFSAYVDKYTKNGFHITKDAGIFRCSR